MAIDFAIKTFDCLLKQQPDDKQGLELGLKLELCSLTNKL